MSPPVPLELLLPFTSSTGKGTEPRPSPGSSSSPLQWPWAHAGLAGHPRLVATQGCTSQKVPLPQPPPSQSRCDVMRVTHRWQGCQQARILPKEDIKKREKKKKVFFFLFPSKIHLCGRRKAWWRILYTDIALLQKTIHLVTGVGGWGVLEVK